MKRWIVWMSLLVLVFFVARRGQAQIILIANPDLKLESISKSDVRNIFTGASSSLKSGPLVKPVLLKKGPAHTEFLATYIGVDDAQFRSDWLKLLFAGKLLLPRSFETEAEVVEFVEQHPATIGYIHRATPHKNVTVLTVK